MKKSFSFLSLWTLLLATRFFSFLSFCTLLLTTRFVPGIAGRWKSKGVRLHVGSSRRDVWKLLQVQSYKISGFIFYISTFLPNIRYYARRLAPRVDIRIVLVALVTIVSALQYYIAWFNFEAAISHLATVPKYRLQVWVDFVGGGDFDLFLQALEVARERRPDLGGKTRAGKEREAAKAREEAAVREVPLILLILNMLWERYFWYWICCQRGTFVAFDDTSEWHISIWQS